MQANIRKSNPDAWTRVELKREEESKREEERKNKQRFDSGIQRLKEKAAKQKLDQVKAIQDEIDRLKRLRDSSLTTKKEQIDKLSSFGKQMFALVEKQRKGDLDSTQQQNLIKQQMKKEHIKIFSEIRKITEEHNQRVHDLEVEIKGHEKQLADFKSS